MLVRLHSGVTVSVEPPDTTALLGCDGSNEGLARVVLVLPDIDVAALDLQHHYMLAEYAIDAFVPTDEGLSMGLACHTFSVLPSVRLGIVDRSIAWQLDVGLAKRVQDYFLEQQENERDDGRERRVVVHDMSATLGGDDGN